MDDKIMVTELTPYLYLLDEEHHATGYLLIGEEKAAVIDTMNGAGDLGAVVKELTDKPVVVVNTHGHPDHILGNVYFDKAYMHPDDNALAEEFLNSIPELQKYMQENEISFPPFMPIHGGDVIDLGGRALEVVELPGHTKGSVVLLDRADRLLFTGDSVNHHLWMQLDHCLTMREAVAAMDKVLWLENEADQILHGHAQGMNDISLLRSLRDGMQEIVDGKTGADGPYKWFGGEDKYHPFKCRADVKFPQEDHVVCYRPDHVG